MGTERFIALSREVDTSTLAARSRNIISRQGHFSRILRDKSHTGKILKQHSFRSRNCSGRISRISKIIVGSKMYYSKKRILYLKRSEYELYEIRQGEETC